MSILSKDSGASPFKKLMPVFAAHVLSVEGQGLRVDNDSGMQARHLLSTRASERHGCLAAQEDFLALSNVCLFVSAGLCLLSSGVFSDVWGTQLLCPNCRVFHCGKY